MEFNLGAPATSDSLVLSDETHADLSCDADCEVMQIVDGIEQMSFAEQRLLNELVKENLSPTVLGSMGGLRLRERAKRHLHTVSCDEAVWVRVDEKLQERMALSEIE